MNAPFTILSHDDVRSCDESPMSSIVEAIARHVSVDGCQFVVMGDAPQVGERFSFAVGPDAAMFGSVRWVLGDRIAFGFDRPIGPEMMATLSAHPGAATTLQPQSLSYTGEKPSANG
jgi:hypothetical protein